MPQTRMPKTRVPPTGARPAPANGAGLDPLIRDLVDWVAREPRPYAEVMELWRTSCPRLTVWEEAMERGLVTLAWAEGEARVAVTEAGRAFLGLSRLS